VNGAFLNPADILDFREQSRSFERIAAWGTLPVNLYGAETPERVEGVFLTPNFFRTLGVHTQLGRDFAERDEPENSVVISHALWLRQFGGDKAAIGRQVSLGLPGSDKNKTLMIIGVLPPEADFPARVDLFTLSEIVRSDVERGGSHNWRTIGRLKPGVTIEQAQGEINTLTERQAEQYPDTNRGWEVHLQPLREYLFAKSRAALLLLFGAVGVVLVIACANVASLELGRNYARRREVALRLALGAGQFRIGRQFLIESFLLSVFGGAGGIFLAIAYLSIVRALGPESIPRLKTASLSIPALFFAMGLAFLSAIVFGLIPALQASRLDINETLKGAQSVTTTSRHSNRIRGILVVGQIALALILLTGAGLVIRSFWQLQAVDPGLKVDHVLTAGLSLSFADYPNGSPKREQLFRQGLERLGALPGVTSVGAISHLPLGGRTMQLPFKIAGQLNVSKYDERVADYRVVTPSFFRTVGVDLKKGRMFDASDHRGSPQVFVVNEAFAGAFLKGLDPIGMQLDGDSEYVKGEIVGVVSNVKHKGLELDAEPAFYVSCEQSATFPLMNYLLRTQTEPATLIKSVQRELQSLDPRGVVFNVRPFTEYIDDAVAPRRFNLWLFAGFGVLAIIVAASGLYATINFAVVQRRREIGIRIALGAQKTAVLGLILREGVMLIACGLLIGFLLSLFLTRWISSLLFSVSETDPLTYLIIASVVIVIGLLASSIPAWRATTVDPIETLRSD
jgi:putative ABC transport system permease protein